MGFEIVLVFIWGVQLIAGVVLGVFDVLRQQWMRAVGAVLGLGVGFLPNMLIQGPAIWKPAQLIALVSVAALAVIFAVRTHWKSLIAVTLIFIMPLAYYLIAISSYPRPVSATVTFVALVAEMELLLGPILCSIATRQLLGWFGDFARPMRKSSGCILGSMFFLTCISAYANEGEDRWRFSENEGKAMLVIADTDEGTDAFGSPFFRCEKGSGRVEIEGSAKEALRRTIGNFITVDNYPDVQLLPIGSGYSDLLTISYSDMHGWRYRFAMSAVETPFEQFKRTGVLEFKLGETLVHEEFKVGLDAIAKFQASCKRPSK